MKNKDNNLHNHFYYLNRIYFLNLIILFVKIKIIYYLLINC